MEAYSAGALCLYQLAEYECSPDHAAGHFIKIVQHFFLITNQTH